MLVRIHNTYYTASIALQGSRPSLVLSPLSGVAIEQPLVNVVQATKEELHIAGVLGLTLVQDSSTVVT